MNMNEQHTCIECDQPAEWLRCTQFAGDHPYCLAHAELEPDFLVNDSYTYWREVKHD